MQPDVHESQTKSVPVKLHRRSNGTWAAERATDPYEEIVDDPASLAIVRERIGEISGTLKAIEGSMELIRAEVRTVKHDQRAGEAIISERFVNSGKDTQSIQMAILDLKRDSLEFRSELHEVRSEVHAMKETVADVLDLKRKLILATTLTIGFVGFSWAVLSPVWTALVKLVARTVG